MLNGYRDYYYKTYLAQGCSPTHLFCILLVYLIIALPFYLAFGGSNFWLQPQNRQMTLQYNYTGLYTAQINWLDGTSTTQDYYSNIPNSGITQPTTRQFTLTNNDQGEKSMIEVMLGSYSGGEVLSVNVVMYYHVHVVDIGKTVTKAVAFTAKGNFISGRMIGVLELNSYFPLNAMGSNVVSNVPPQYPLLTTQFTYSDLLTHSLTHTDTLLPHLTSSLTTITNNPSSRSLSLILTKHTLMLVQYYPSVLQTFKFKWSRYLAFAIVFYYILSSLFKVMLRDGLLDSISVVEKAK